MKLYFSQTSPYVRKVLVVAHALGLDDRIEKLPSAAHPVKRDREIVAVNPLGQVPTLITDEDVMLTDSRVICEYLDQLTDGSVFPAAGPARWRALTDQAIGDGATAAALLARYETAVRPSDKQWSDWLDGQVDKITETLAMLEKNAASYGDRFDIGTISLACLLGYLDLRFPALSWRNGRPETAAWFARFDERPAMVATRLQG